jgi:predicted transport protein
VNDLKLFQINGRRAVELPGRGVNVELELQRLIEGNMEVLFGVRLVAAAYRFSGWRDGEIDALGLDENGSPVIFEFKRTSDQNVIGQGLFYLDWLLDHTDNFRVLVEKALGREAAEGIDWHSPRLVCVAGAFNRYDEHSVDRIDQPIELVRYRAFGDGGFLALELVKARAGTSSTGGAGSNGRRRSRSAQSVTTVTGHLAQAPVSPLEVYGELEVFCEALGDEVTKRTTKSYVAIRRLRNFVCVEVRPKELVLYLKVDPATVPLRQGFSRSVRGIGHQGTGDLELRIREQGDLHRSLDLIRASYHSS